MTTDANGAKVLELRYKAWGEIRATWTSSPSTTPAYKMPLYQYTGQAAYLDDPLTSGVTEGFGLMFYQSRFYAPQLGRFTQADTIIPGGAQGLDRYAYVNNSPIKLSDPSGHKCVGDAAECLNDGKKGAGFTGGDTKPTFGNGCGGTGQIRCGGNLPTYGNGLIGPSVDPCSNGQTCLLPWTPPQSYSNPPTVQPSILIEIESLTIGFIDDMATASPQMYRKAFTLGKAFNPNPIVDVVLGAVGQGLDDAVNSTNLSFEQRVGKIIITGAESGVTGVASDLVGAGAAYIAPHPLVYAGGQVVSSVAIDYWFWPWVNKKYLGSEYGY